MVSGLPIVHTDFYINTELLPEKYEIRWGSGFTFSAARSYSLNIQSPAFNQLICSFKEEVLQKSLGLLFTAIQNVTRVFPIIDDDKIVKYRDIFIGSISVLKNSMVQVIIDLNALDVSRDHLMLYPKDRIKITDINYTQDK